MGARVMGDFTSWRLSNAGANGALNGSSGFSTAQASSSDVHAGLFAMLREGKEKKTRHFGA